jgi:hypothetical protein
MEDCILSIWCYILLNEMLIWFLAWFGIYWILWLQKFFHIRKSISWITIQEIKILYGDFLTLWHWSVNWVTCSHQSILSVKRSVCEIKRFLYENGLHSGLPQLQTVWTSVDHTCNIISLVFFFCIEINKNFLSGTELFVYTISDVSG